MFAKARSRASLRVPALILALAWAFTQVTAGLLALPGAVRAQGSDDYFFEDEEFFPGEDPFQEQDDFGLPVDDFTESGEFIDESTLGPSDEAAALGGRQQQLRLLGEREMMPLNAAWGAGTGLLIGGWFALINQGTNRQTQRSLGLGVVIGTLIGLAVGARSLITPNAPRPAGAFNEPRHDPWSDEPGGHTFTASSAPSGIPVTLSFHFRF